LRTPAGFKILAIAAIFWAKSFATVESVCLRYCQCNALARRQSVNPVPGKLLKKIDEDLAEMKSARKPFPSRLKGVY